MQANSDAGVEAKQINLQFEEPRQTERGLLEDDIADINGAEIMLSQVLPNSKTAQQHLSCAYSECIFVQNDIL